MFFTLTIKALKALKLLSATEIYLYMYVIITDITTNNLL